MMWRARDDFIDCRGLMPCADQPFKVFPSPRPKATITGVGFPDRVHGPTPDGI
jgi:hypothetical protein